MTLDDAVLALGPTRSPGGYWRAEAGPLLAAACLHATDPVKGPALPAFAVSGFHRLITEHGPDYTAPDGLAGMFFACHLGHAQQVLRTTSNLAPAEDAYWTAALTGIAQAAIDAGELHWYANGNIAIGWTLVMALCWKATGQQQWRDRYEEAIERALRPNPTRWPGRGLVVTNYGAWQGDGTDRAGYLTEEGPGGIGFDTDYTVLQAGQAARLWLLTGDWKARQLLHTLWGQLAPLTDAAATIDMSLGTRHPYPGARWDLVTGAVAVLAARPDVQPLTDAYWRKVTDPARYPVGMNAAGYYGIGLDLGTALLARAGWKPKP